MLAERQESYPKVVGVAVAVDHGGHVEVGAFRGEGGFGPGDGEEELAADVGGFGPEGAVFGGSPAGPELVEGGQVVGGVGETFAGAVALGDEADHGVGFFGHRAGDDGAGVRMRSSWREWVWEAVIPRAAIAFMRASLLGLGHG